MAGFGDELLDFITGMTQLFCDCGSCCRAGIASPVLLQLHACKALLHRVK